MLFYVCREINMLGFICSLFLNEKGSTISIRKRNYSFTGKISRYCKEVEQPWLIKNWEKIGKMSPPLFEIMAPL